MAKTLTAAATAVWKRKHGRKETYTVEYKRRYWNGSAYVYESSWNVLTPSDIPAPGSISWKLDTTNQNTILSSNVTLTMDNSTGKWLGTNYSPSVYAPDSTATLGYEPYMTKFRIQFGYILDDGNTELVSLFVGYLKDFTLRGGKSTISYTLIGTEILLENADAQNVSDAFTLEDCSPATGDGSNRIFTTTSVGVWQISAVQQNAVTKTQGTDYTISGLDETGVATITMAVAPTAGHTMKSTGKKWKAGYTIEALIALLCDESGIGSGVRTINAVLFPGGVSSAVTIDTESDWNSGTKTNCDVTSSSGTLRRRWITIDKFTDNDYTADPIWTIQYNENGLGSVSAAGSALAVTVTDSPSNLNIDTPIDERAAYGSWDFSLRSNGNPGDTGSAAYCQFIQYGSNGVGYSIVHSLASGNYIFGRQGGSFTPLLTLTGSVDTSAHTWRVTRTSDGTFNIYRDGDTTPVGTYLDNEYTLTNHVGLRVSYSQTGTMTATLDSIYISNEVLTPATAVSDSDLTWESAEQNLGSAPVAWGQLERTETLNGGTIAYSTNVSSSSGMGYDGYVAIAADGTIESALKQYFKIKVVFSTASGSQTAPEVEKLIARYSSSTIVTSIAIFKGKTCFQAIQDLAKIADYEWGFDGAGDFFFRSKTVSGAASLELDQDSAILDLTQYRPGWDKVINCGQVKYGSESQYYSEYNGATASEASPTSEERFSAKIKSETFSYLLANDADLGTARARRLYEANYLPRARCSVSLWMTPQADLSDIASVSYFDDPKKRSPMIGDELQPWGYGDIGEPGNVVMRDKRMKLVGVTYNIKDRTTDLELLEIL